MVHWTGALSIRGFAAFLEEPGPLEPVPSPSRGALQLIRGASAAVQTSKTSEPVRRRVPGPMLPSSGHNEDRCWFSGG